jgi:dipeptidyl aminopeptidase/acylaminoacyl peptidase
MIKKVFFQNSKGNKLAGILHLPDKEGKFPAVVRACGFMSAKESGTGKAIGESLGDDFIYLVFDFYGSGESDGKFFDLTPTEEFDDMKAAIDFVYNLEQVDKERIGIVGSSLGGMVVIYAAANDPRVKAAVFGAPVTNFKKCFSRDKYNPVEWREQGYRVIQDHTGKEFRISYNFFEDGCKYDLFKEAEKINIPVLVIQGDKDESIPLEDTQKFMPHLKNAKLYVVEGAEHVWSTQPDKLKIFVEKISEFFKQNLASD